MDTFGFVPRLLRKDVPPLMWMYIEPFGAVTYRRRHLEEQNCRGQLSERLTSCNKGTELNHCRVILLIFQEYNLITGKNLTFMEL